MSIPHRELIEILQFIVSDHDELSVWQTFILGLWIFCLLLQKLIGTAAGLLEQYFLDSVVTSESSSSGRSCGRDVRSETSVDVGLDGDSFADLGEPTGRSGGLKPLLPNVVVRERILAAISEYPFTFLVASASSY